jgi:hypothetical protein
VEPFAALVKPVASNACLAATLAIVICAKWLSRLRVSHGAIWFAPSLAFAVFGFVLSFSIAFLLLSLAFVRLRLVLGLMLISPLAFVGAIAFRGLCRGVVDCCSDCPRQSRHGPEKESNSAVDHELVEQPVQWFLATNVWADPATSSLRREHE